MKLTDRLNLLKAGYSRQEIEAMIEADDTAPDVNAPDTTAVDPVANPQDNTAVLTAIDELTKAIQASNILNSSRDSAPQVNESVEDILNTLVNGKKGE
jgi:hypothetical protein